jgi:uncharacterized protein HemX
VLAEAYAHNDDGTLYDRDWDENQQAYFDMQEARTQALQDELDMLRNDQGKRDRADELALKEIEL